MDMEISLVWWNTSLSPASKADRATEGDLQVAQAMIRVFVDELAVDLIALGEVSSNNIEAIQSNIDSNEFSFVDAASKVGSSNFDLGIIYRNSKFLLISSKTIIINNGDRRLKLGQQLEFRVAGAIKPIHIIVSHWPSRLWTEADHSDRHLLGIRLRDVIEEILKSDDSANVILLGDYNDEPFDRSISDHVMATRDKSLAAKKAKLFYNPFWRHLGHVVGEGGDEEYSIYSGSYFHKSGSVTRWRTFDQIILSSSFLGSGEWALNEKRTQVLNVPTYTKHVVDPKEIFDHLPVIGVISRRI